MGTNLLVGYTGAYQDVVTGGYTLGNGYRMYLPELMRFNSPDSWSPFGKGGIHPYAYCEDDPINHADPSGHFAFLVGLGLQILAIGFMVMPGGQEVGVAEEMTIPVLEAVDATTVATREVTDRVGGVIPEATTSTSRATGAAEYLASTEEATQSAEAGRPYDWDAAAPAPAPSRPTLSDLIQRAITHVNQDRREVAAHYNSLLQSNVRGVRSPDEQKLRIHQLARELEREDVYAKDLEGFTSRRQLARDLGSNHRAFTDIRTDVRRHPGSRSQKAYVLHWFFDEDIDLGEDTVVHVG